MTGPGQPTAGEQTGVPVGDDAPVLEVMRTMRAMRRLAPEPVPEELLERLVEAATWGPSGSNAQAFDFVVVTDRGVMAELAPLWRRCVDSYMTLVGDRRPATMDQARFDALRRAIAYQAEHFAQTPALIVPCYRYPNDPLAVMRDAAATLRGLEQLGPQGAARLLGRLQRIGLLTEASSVYPGVQNLLLTARALGLGANITLWHLFLEHEWKAVLGIPRRVHTFAVIPVGFPLGRFGPVARRDVASAIHRDRWRDT